MLEIHTHSSAHIKPHQPGLYKWIVLAVTTLCQTGISFISLGVSAVIPFIAKQFLLNNMQVAFIIGAVNVGMALTSMVFGQMVDYFGEKRVLVVGGIMTGLSVLTASFSTSFGLLLTLLLLTGLWAASSTPAGSKAIMTWFPYTIRGFAISIRQTGTVIGGFLSAIILPLISVWYNWHIALVFTSVMAITVSLTCWFVYHEEDDDLPRDRKNRHLTNIFSGIKVLLQNKSLWLASVAATTFIGAQFILLGYTQLFLQEQAHISLRWTAYFLAIVQLAGAVGRIIWGMISDRLFVGARKPVMIIIGIFMALSCLSMLLINTHTPIWLIGLLFTCFGFTAVGWNGVWVTQVSELSGKAHAGTAVGISMTVLQMGVLVFPFLFGGFIDWFHTYTASWLVLFAIICFGIWMHARVRETPHE
jgi:sugar phosphate permease